MPDAPFDEKNSKEMLRKFQTCEVARQSFKKDSNGSQDISLSPIDEFGNTILHMNASLGNEDKPAELLFYCMLNGLKNKNPRNNEGLTPLHIIASKGNLKICEFIIGCIKDKNPKDSKRRTPLHFAAIEGHTSVCELIVKNVTDVNPSNEHGQTPLQGYLLKRDILMFADCC